MTSLLSLRRYRWIVKTILAISVLVLMRICFHNFMSCMRCMTPLTLRKEEWVSNWSHQRQKAMENSLGEVGPKRTELSFFREMWRSLEKVLELEEFHWLTASKTSSLCVKTRSCHSWQLCANSAILGLSCQSLAVEKANDVRWKVSDVCTIHLIPSNASA